MKKYIKPAVITVKLDNQAILAGSNVDIDNKPIDGDNVGAKGGIFNSSWSDEEE